MAAKLFMFGVVMDGPGGKFLGQLVAASETEEQAIDLVQREFSQSEVIGPIEMTGGWATVSDEKPVNEKGIQMVRDYFARARETARINAETGPTDRLGEVA